MARKGINRKGFIHAVLFWAFIGGAGYSLWRVYGWAPLGIAALAALIVYSVTYHLFYWELPRRHPHIPGFLVCFIGAYILSLAAPGDPWGPWACAVALAGAFLLFYVVVKSGTPSHAGVLVNCDFVSTAVKDPEGEGPVRKALREWWIKDPGDKVPYVWPYRFLVAQEGIVCWHLHGKSKEMNGATVVVSFADRHGKTFNPFRADGQPSVFPGVVPGRIVAGPAIVPGRGGYTIRITTTTGQQIVLDPDGGTSGKGG